LQLRWLPFVDNDNKVNCSVVDKNEIAI